MTVLISVLQLLPAAVFAAALPRPNENIHARLEAFTSLPVTTSYISSISSLQSVKSTLSAGMTGSIFTSLESGHESAAPFPTVTHSPVGSLAPATTELSVAVTTPTAPTSSNVFVPIATDAPPIRSRSDHPLPQLGIVNQTGPSETNKFYANFFLGSQGCGAWTHPYSVTWSKGGGNAGSWGLSISHVERSQFAYGSGEPVQYFIAPIGIQSMILSAKELGSSTELTTDTLTAFSANVNLAPSQGTKPCVSFPLVQGMGFVTAVYNGATPWLQSGVFFSTLDYVGPLQGNSTYKYRITLADSTKWLVYITPSGSAGNVPLTLTNNTLIAGPASFNGIIQVAKNPAGDDGEASYDASAGVYAESATISASVNDATGTYTIAWKKGGLTNRTLLMFALPHHVASFDGQTNSTLTGIQLMTTTKGMATAIVADQMTMVETDLPTTMGFAPWSPGSNVSTADALSTDVINMVNDVASTELGEDMASQCILNSMYYSGKALAKFATILYTLNDMSQNTKLAAAGLSVLKDVYNVFVNNTQPYPLVYDTVWKGAVSEASYLTNDSGVDFGNSYYNDHHFHYGYFVYAAAVIAYLDPGWLTNGTNKAWVEMLIRDYSNSASDDPYFPFSRSFDWYHGHSWAKGLFESADGKDEESSSEDTFATYAIKMWGKVIGDPNLEARGNLQLAVQKRSLQNYFLYESTNNVQPPQVIGNKVSGILFENKIDHTTYFGTNIEYIEGIHMIPISPATAYTRSTTFVTEEWNTYFSWNGTVDRISTIEGGWRGILMANYALVNQTASYEFFAAGDPGSLIKPRGAETGVGGFGKGDDTTTFDNSWLDGGASRTWYLAWAAALGEVASS